MVLIVQSLVGYVVNLESDLVSGCLKPGFQSTRPNTYPSFTFRHPRHVFGVPFPLSNVFEKPLLGKRQVSLIAERLPSAKLVIFVDILKLIVPLEDLIDTDVL